MESLGEGLKKIILAGIGTAATTVEKSKEILDDMVKKGELTVEQGKVLNQELKHNMKQTIKNNVHVSMKASTPEELEEMLGNMTPEQLEQLKIKLGEAEAKKADGRKSDETAQEAEDTIS